MNTSDAQLTAAVDYLESLLAWAAVLHHVPDAGAQAAGLLSVMRGYEDARMAISQLPIRPENAVMYQYLEPLQATICQLHLAVRGSCPLN